MLLDRSGEIEDHWPEISDSEPLPAQGYALVPLVRLKDATDADGVYLGASVPNDTDPEELVSWFGRLGLISVDFPSFADGRGFSIAASLRERGFAGRLRADGPVIADQFEYLLSCGFDEVKVPEDVAIRQPPAHWTSQLDRISMAYQRRPGTRASILDQRRRAKSA